MHRSPAVVRVIWLGATQFRTTHTRSRTLISVTFGVAARALASDAYVAIVLYTRQCVSVCVRAGRVVTEERQLRAVFRVSW